MKNKIVTWINSVQTENKIPYHQHFVMSYVVESVQIISLL